MHALMALLYLLGLCTGLLVAIQIRHPENIPPTECPEGCSCSREETGR